MAKLPAPVHLTEKQARFVQLVAAGMTAREAYRASYDTEADDQAVDADARRLKNRPQIALALKEVLRSRRLQDMDSIGELMSDVKQDQELARQAGNYNAVMAANRMRGNWQGLDKQTLIFRLESTLTDDELVERLAGDDPSRIEAAKTLLGVREGFPEPEDADWEEVPETDEASQRAKNGQE